MLLRRVSPVRPGWVAIAMMGSRACAAWLERKADGQPRVHWIEHLSWIDADQSLRQLRRDHGLDQHTALAVLPRGQYQMVAMESPEVPKEEWRDAIRWKMQDMVDFPMDSASIDLLEVPTHTSQRGRPAVIAVAAPRAPLAELTLAARKARVRWTAFDVAECALRNLSALSEPLQRGQALLHVGNEVSTLVLTAGGELLLSRSIDVTLPQFLTDPDDPLAAEAFQNAADRVGLEIQRTLDSFERQFTEVSVARIVVAPTGLDRFIRHIADLVYVPVEALALTELFDLTAVGAMDPPTLQADALLALGAALRTH